MKVEGGDGSLLVDISDALSERDRVRFTVHTRTKLPQFDKQIISVVRQHEEFIWLHDCLVDNDQYAGYIIPPPPPRPEFEASREKLQRLGDGESSMTKEEFAKMKQELEAEYLAMFKKTVAMHEIFLQRLAVHEKFREDNNFKIFLEYENELAVRSKSTKERLAGSISNIGKSLTDFVITTSQVAATNSASTALLSNHSSPSRTSIISVNNSAANQQNFNGNTSVSDISSSSSGRLNSSTLVTSSDEHLQQEPNLSKITSDENNGNRRSAEENTKININNNNNNNNNNYNIDDDNDEQYFEKERLFLALYHSSIKETALQSDRVCQLQKCVADYNLYIAQQLVKLASIEVLPITAQTKDSSSFVTCPLPSLSLPNSNSTSSNQIPPIVTSTSNQLDLSKPDDELDNELDSTNYLTQPSSSKVNNIDNKQGDILNIKTSNQSKIASNGCANNHTSEGLKQLLLHVSDYLEQARKIETRIASDEDLKLTDTFLYYKRETVAAQDLLTRRLRFMAEYETATKNLEKARQKGRTQMQYADVIQKQAKENFSSISKQAKQELIDYKQRRVSSFRKAFSDLVELELKQLKAHSKLITNCLNTCRGTTTN